MNVVELKTKAANTIEQVKTLIEAGDTNGSAVARAIGVSPAAISQVLKGNYKGDTDRIVKALAKWLELRNTRTSTLPAAPRFVETQTASNIFGALGYAHAAETISVVYGASGVGKTTAAREYAKQHSNVWLITASPSCATTTEILFELALELRMDDAPRRKGQLSRAVKHRLQGTGGMVVVDEADHLEYAALEELRILQEQTGIGMVLMGNNRVYTQLTGGRRSEDFARLFSRIAKKMGVHKAKQTDVNAIAAAWGLTDKAEQALLQQIAERPGALRILNQTLRLAAMLAGGSDQPLGEQHIRAAFKDLEGNE
ncbi:AAA family ATPase [Gallaecimonas mangrovi]|uniref:AAA family ATPase n=1 Tax=Gallaecimonas mangrovi TaxID=2291597 RepID=UPI000E2035FD|nr:AAA family ATPase [Gallaecimonas mangrovi]